MEQHQLVKGCSNGISDANAPLQRGLLIVPLLFSETPNLSAAIQQGGLSMPYLIQNSQNSTLMTVAGVAAPGPASQFQCNDCCRLFSSKSAMEQHQLVKGCSRSFSEVNAALQRGLFALMMHYSSIPLILPAAIQRGFCMPGQDELHAVPPEHRIVTLMWLNSCHVLVLPSHYVSG